MANPRNDVDPNDAIPDIHLRSLGWSEPQPDQLELIEGAYREAGMRVPEQPYRVSTLAYKTDEAFNLQESMKTHHGLNAQLVLVNPNAQPDPKTNTVTNMYGLVITGEEQVKKLYEAIEKQGGQEAGVTTGGSSM